MKTDKKLKRGLADLSAFFAEPVPVGEKQPVRSRIVIQPPESSNVSLNPHLITASFISFSESFQLQNLIEFSEEIKFSFQETHFISLREEDNSVEQLTMNKEIHYQKVAWNRLVPIMQLQICPNADMAVLNKGAATALVLIDSGIYGSSETNSRVPFELLDHCVFAVEPDTKQLMRAYQIMKTALSKNPNIHYSMLLVGSGAERFSEFIYERFSDIISHFLGHSFGFLGWVENRQICLNLELLKEESDSAFVQYSKTHLTNLLFSSVTNESF